MKTKADDTLIPSRQEYYAWKKEFFESDPAHWFLLGRAFCGNFGVDDSALFHKKDRERAEEMILSKHVED